jgi:hypothetical protein
VIILADQHNDTKLRRLVAKATELCNAISVTSSPQGNKESELDESDEEKMQINNVQAKAEQIARLVIQECGGECDDNFSALHARATEKFKAKGNVVALCSTRYCGKAQRALLFKYLLDRFDIPCTLERVGSKNELKNVPAPTFRLMQPFKSDSNEFKDDLELNDSNKEGYKDSNRVHSSQGKKVTEKIQQQQQLQQQQLQHQLLQQQQYAVFQAKQQKIHEEHHKNLRQISLVPKWPNTTATADIAWNCISFDDKSWIVDLTSLPTRFYLAETEEALLYQQRPLLGLTPQIPTPIIAFNKTIALPDQTQTQLQQSQKEQKEQPQLKKQKEKA